MKYRVTDQFNARLKQIHLILICLVLLLAAATATAKAPAPEISAVTVMNDLHAIAVEGANFAADTPLLVTLGLASGPGDITADCTYDDTLITCDFPAGLPPAGDYQLLVSTGDGKGKQGDEYDLTIGAVGPPGPEGPEGPQGTAAPRPKLIIGGGTDSLPTEPTVGYMGPFSNFLSVSNSDARRPLIATGYISKFRVRLENGPGGDGSDQWLFTIRKDGAATSLGCNVFEDFVKCSDLVDCVDWSAGQAIDVSVTTSGNPTQSAVAYWTAEYRQGESCP